jgi:hypothetical protein
MEALSFRGKAGIEFQALEEGDKRLRRGLNLFCICSRWASYCGRVAEMLWMIGQAFSRLVVIAFERKKRGYRHWRCRCTCGSETTVREDHLRDGSTRSCGCLRRSTWAEFRLWQRSGG